MIVTVDDPATPLYQATGAGGYGGVALILVSRSDGLGVCSGSLLPGRAHVLTAAHCLTDGTGTDVTSLVDVVVEQPDGDLEFLTADVWTVHPGWTGDFFLGDDLAVLGLASPASPEIPVYEVYRGSSEGSAPFEVVGWGVTGTGDTGGTTLDFNRRRGRNQFEATLEAMLGAPNSGDVVVADFDNGVEANDAFGYFFGVNGLGLGELEAAPGQGDSGGPAFLGSEIAGVVSFGLRLSFTSGETSDIDGFLNTSFGEFQGYTRVSSYVEWLDQVTAVPEPANAILLFLGMAVILGGRFVFRPPAATRANAYLPRR